MHLYSLMLLMVRIMKGAAGVSEEEGRSADGGDDVLVRFISGCQEAPGLTSKLI